MHGKIEDERAGGASLEEAATKLKLPVTTFDAVDRFGRDPTGKPVVNLPRGADIMNAAFSTDVGVDNDPIAADGGYVWYDVAGITPAHERPLDEVKGDLSNKQSTLKAALAKLEFEGPAGHIKLDENRNAIGTTFITEVTKAADGSFYNKVVKTVPNVSETLGLSKAAFDKMGLGNRDVPNCP